MPKRLSWRHARAAFEKAGFVLSRTIYTDSLTPMWCRCSVCQRRMKKPLKAIRAGRGCGYCGRARRRAEVMFSLEQAREFFAEANLNLQAKKYQRVMCPMPFRCQACGFQGSLSLHAVKNLKQGCRVCRKRERFERPFDFGEFKTRAAAKGIRVLSRRCDSAAKDVRVECRRCGKRFDLNANGLAHGLGCWQCQPTKKARSWRLDLAELKREVRRRKIRIEAKDCPNAYELLECRCLECREFFKMSAWDLHRGRGCRVCHFRERTEDGKLDFRLLKQHAKERGLKVNSTAYLNSWSKLDLECRRCGYEFKASANVLRKGHGCRMCGARRAGDTMKISEADLRARMARWGITMVSPYADYRNTKSKVRVRYDACGHARDMTMGTLQLTEGRCKLCRSAKKPL